MEIENLIKAKKVITGRWWFSDNKRRQFVGTITFDQQVALEISGTGKIDLTKNKYDEICGRGSDGEYFILRNCYVTRSITSHTKGGWSISLLPTDVISFTSSVTTKWNTTTLTHFEAQIPYLDFWLDHKLFDTSFTDHVIKFDNEKNETAELGEAKLVLSTRLMGIAGWNINTRNRMDIRQHSVLRLEYPQEVEYAQAIQLYRRLEGFFRIAYASNFYLRRFDASFLRYTRLHGHKAPNVELKEIYLNRFIDKNVERSPSIIDQLFLFKFKDLEDFGKVIARWLEIEKPLQPVYQLLLTSLENGVYLEQRFISLVNAVEIFHRRFNGRQRKPDDEWLAQKKEILSKLTGKNKKLVNGRLRDANELTLEERIADLVQSANNTGFRGLMPETITKIAETRNSFVHRDFGGTNDLDIIEASDALTEILFSNILLEIGFATEEIRPMARNNEIFRYSSGLRIKDV